MYRKLLALVAALTIASPVLADDASMATPDSTTPAATTTQDSTTTTTTTTEMKTDKVDINKASAKELMKVKGINATRARAIVSYRKKHGDFKSVDDLKNVRGFSKMKSSRLNAIQDHLMTE